MAKPIIHITTKYEYKLDEYKLIAKSVKKQTGNEYHVLISTNTNIIESIKIEVFNDNKGLTDIDIEKLIEKLIK